MTKSPSLPQVTIFTDGACIGNPGPGGYGAIVIHGRRRKEIAQGFRLTTNNRMEILAAVAALERLREPCAVTLFTDSRYVRDSVMKGWARRWRANGWKRNAKESAVNPDLWARLLDQCDRHQVEMRWIRGHAGHPENERCDRLANAAARGADLAIDENYEQGLAIGPPTLLG